MEDRQSRIFDETIKMHYGKLRQMVDRRIYSPSDREDIFQEGLREFYSALPRFRGECSGYFFALSCISNVIKRYARKQSRGHDLQYIEDPAALKSDSGLASAIESLP